MIPQITVTELKQKMEDGEDFLLLDVREEKEYQQARIEGSLLIPLSVLQQRVSDLKDHRHKEIVVHCKMGGRSQQACEFLHTQGFKVKNLSGGITAWSTQIDPSVPVY